MRKAHIFALGLASLGALASAESASAFSICTWQERGCLDRVDSSKNPTPQARNQCIDKYKTCIIQNSPEWQAQHKAENAALVAAARNNVTNGGGPQSLYPAQGGPGPRPGALPGSSSGSRSRYAQ